MAKKISKEMCTSFPSHIIRSRYPEQDEFTTNIKYVSDDTVSTVINISPSPYSLFSFSDDNLSTETGCKIFTNPMPLHLKTCLIASTLNNISQENDVPILTISSNLEAAMITSNHPCYPKFFYFISPEKVNPYIQTTFLTIQIRQ